MQPVPIYCRYIFKRYIFPVPIYCRYRYIADMSHWDIVSDLALCSFKRIWGAMEYLMSLAPKSSQKSSCQCNGWLRIGCWILFLALQNSSIGDLVPCLLWHHWQSESSQHYRLQSDPRYLWPLSHLWQFLMTIFDNNFWWQLRTWIHDNLCDLTIKSDSGQHSQFLRSLYYTVYCKEIFCASETKKKQFM